MTVTICVSGKIVYFDLPVGLCHKYKKSNNTLMERKDW